MAFVRFLCVFCSLFLVAKLFFVPQNVAFATEMSDFFLLTIVNVLGWVDVAKCRICQFRETLSPSLGVVGGGRKQADDWALKNNFLSIFVSV